MGVNDLPLGSLYSSVKEGKDSFEQQPFLGVLTDNNDIKF